MNTYRRLVLLALVLVCSNSFAQEKLIKKMESTIANALAKAYPASVRMWGFDTTRNERTSAQFSGVVVTEDGYILTAAHTIQPGSTYKVFFPDGRTCIAGALGKIEVKETPGAPDVGMMKILTPGKWPYAEMGYSDSLIKGQTCLSISYPESLNQPLPTLRLGEIVVGKNEYGFIQSTCKMEPGDSGGPLFDQLGRVIGLHSAIDVSEEMNFEVPVNLYRKYWSALMLAETYTSLPLKGDLDASQKSVVDKNVSTISSLHYSPKIKNGTYVVSSVVNGAILQVRAALLNVINASGKKTQVLISKNSLLGEKAKIVVDGSEIGLTALARDKENDLVLLSLSAKLSGGLMLEDKGSKSTVNPLGTLLFTVKEDGTSLQSVAGSDTISLPKKVSMPYLGAMVAYNSSPAVFSLVKAESPSAFAGLEIGDELVSIDGRKVERSIDFMPVLSSYWPGDTIVLSWTREGKPFSKPILLKAHNQGVSNHPAERFAGGKSDRRDGFRAVYTHDLALTPQMAGSAVVNSKGGFYGINIARFSRTTTLVVPAATVYKFVIDTLVKLKV